MTERRRVGSCACGHDWALHDAWGCAAYLGAFEATRDQQQYCACRRAAAEAPVTAEASDAAGLAR